MTTSPYFACPATGVVQVALDDPDATVESRRTRWPDGQLAAKPVPRPLGNHPDRRQVIG
ncbi:hypothetical protein [Kibdelosporangium philippinense]|uniref:hypothetical protein n=1 Tax=Kibdelosporangium philippinense TaxID=211113 RepID=UPI00361B621B